MNDDMRALLASSHSPISVEGAKGTPVDSAAVAKGRFQTSAPTLRQLMLLPVDMSCVASMPYSMLTSAHKVCGSSGSREADNSRLMLLRHTALLPGLEPRHRLKDDRLNKLQTPTVN